MSNESSELTFVRCPQCRRLVSAVSTRCRHCTASLESSGVANANAQGNSKVVPYPGASEQGSKTSANNGSVANAKSAASTAVKPAEELQDPLADFLDQLEEVELADNTAEPAEDFSQHEEDPFGEEPQSQALPNEEADDYDFDDFDEELKALFSEEELPEEAPVAQAPISKQASELPPAKPVKTFVTPQREVLRDSETSGRATSERRFVEPEEVVRKAPAPLPGKITKSAEIPVTARAQATKVQTRKSFVEKQEEDEFLPVAANEVEDFSNLADEPVVQEHAATVVENQTKPPKINSSTASGSLVGWLVSFTNPKGAAIEIRTGKFFVSKSSIKKSDLVISHSSISSPHAMFNVSAVDNVQLQDLMSEHGLYIKRRGNQSYRKEEDVASLRHGDYVKFGEVEYLVSLLPESE